MHLSSPFLPKAPHPHPSNRPTATDLAPIPDLQTITSAPEAYGVSKRVARAASLSFIHDQKPAFDIVNILPSLVLGRNELVTSVREMAESGTNRVVVGLVTGADQTAIKDSAIGATVHVNDCAELHVRALSPEIPAGDYLAHATNVDWSDGTAVEIAKREFADEVKAGLLNPVGELEGVKCPFDSRETESVFGIGWLGFEEQVRSVIGQYVELVKAEEGGGVK